LPHRRLACGLPDGFLLDLGNGGVRLPTKLPGCRNSLPTRLPGRRPAIARWSPPLVATSPPSFQ
jgi:hypothetical protein